MNEYITMFTRIVLGLLFAYSFARKVTDVLSFAQSISSFGLFPKIYSKPLAILVLLAELVIIFFFVIGSSVLILAFILAAALLTIFSLALFLVLQQKKMVACNCFGSNRSIVTGFDLVRNIGFILCALTGIFAATFKDSSVNLGIADWSLTVLASSFFLIVWLHLSEIVQLLLQD